MKLPFLAALESFIGKAQGKLGVRSSPYPILFLGLSIFMVAFLFMPGVVATALSLALFLAPLWLPFVLVSGAWTLWVIMKRSEFIASQEVILLEIIPPRSVVKTPLAMESVLSGLHLGPGESTWYKQYIRGAVRPWWSLELVSLEGRVHFYIWTRSNFRRIIESQIYAQYPGAQVVTATDYARTLSASAEEWEVWGCDYKPTAPNPLPIKTYVDYGLDKTQKEPEQVDPLANLLEFMGAMGKGEYLWLQIVIRTHKGEKYGKKNAAGKPYTWKDEAKEMVDKMRDETRGKYTDPATGVERAGFPNPTKGEAEKIAAIERNVSKLAFDTGARCIYLAKPGTFDPVNISAVTGIFKQFSSEGWNGFAPTGWMTVFDDYPWEIGASKMKAKYRAWLVDAYRRRQFFHEPYDEPFSGDNMVMSTEELATLYHIPSRAVETPGLTRVQSATAEAPANLPT